MPSHIRKQSTAACDESSSVAEVIRINQVPDKELRALRIMVEDQNTKIANHCRRYGGKIESHLVPKKTTERSKAVPKDLLVSCLSYTTQCQITFSLIKPGQSEDIVWFHGCSGVRVVTKVRSLQYCIIPSLYLKTDHVHIV